MAVIVQVGYSGFISIEMRDSGGSVQAVAQALNFVKRCTGTLWHNRGDEEIDSSARGAHSIIF